LALTGLNFAIPAIVTSSFSHLLVEALCKNRR
jgi:hypothetical protein